MAADEYPLWAQYLAERYGGGDAGPVDAGRVTQCGNRLRVGGTGGRTIRGAQNIRDYLEGFARAASG